jgi:hypothetical protein
MPYVDYSFIVHFMIKNNKVDVEAKSFSTFRLKERVPLLLVYYIKPVFIAGRKEWRQSLLTCEKLLPLGSRKWIMSKENTA